MSEDKAAPAAKGRCVSHRALRSTRGSLLSTSACPGEVGSGSPTKDMRQDRNLQRFRGRAHQRVTPYEWEALYGDGLRAGLTKLQEPDIAICIQRRCSAQAVAWWRSIGIAGRDHRNAQAIRSMEWRQYFSQIQEVRDTPWRSPRSRISSIPRRAASDRRMWTGP